MNYGYDAAGRLLGDYTNALRVVRETVTLGELPIVVLGQTVTGSPASFTTQVYRVYADQIGTPRVITQATDNKMRWRWDSAEPFGTTPAQENPAAVGVFGYDPRFAGQMRDKETGLHYNWHRDYDAGVGRYVQSDPIGLAGGINTYAYVDGNPVSLTDPLGLAAYMCTQPLHALGAAGRTVYSPSSNPLYHQFIGVIRPDGSVITGGQDRAGGPWGPGRPSEGDGAPGSGAECKKVEDDNECIEQCLMGRFAAPRPRYSLALQGRTGGQNCQGWADSTLAQCQASCKAKR